jgi:hypothetical protein
MATMSDQPKEQMFLVSSGYGGNTKRPFVQIQHPAIDRPLTISPNEARALALNIMECADAAESDGFLVEFFKGEMEQPDQTIAYLLVQFREYRKKRADLDKGINKFVE